MLSEAANKKFHISWLKKNHIFNNLGPDLQEVQEFSLEFQRAQKATAAPAAGTDAAPAAAPPAAPTVPPAAAGAPGQPGRSTIPQQVLPQIIFPNQLTPYVKTRRTEHHELLVSKDLFFLF